MIIHSNQTGLEANSRATTDVAHKLAHLYDKFDLARMPQDVQDAKQQASLEILERTLRPGCPEIRSVEALHSLISRQRRGNRKPSRRPATSDECADCGRQHDLYRCPKEKTRCAKCHQDHQRRSLRNPSGYFYSVEALEVPSSEPAPPDRLEQLETAEERSRLAAEVITMANGTGGKIGRAVNLVVFFSLAWAEAPRSEAASRCGITPKQLRGRLAKFLTRVHKLGVA